MQNSTLDRILNRAQEAYRAKFYCSEAVVLAMGEHYLSPLPEILLRASNPFGGGVAGCRQELCGALGGGILILGALWGRTSSTENDEHLKGLICRLREGFIARYGSTTCQPIRDVARDEVIGCLPVVEEAVRILVPLIEEEIERGALPTREYIRQKE